MSARFLLRCEGVGVEVYDASTGDANSGTTVFGPASYDTASRWAADRNRANASPRPAAPICARCERLEKAIRHYWIAMSEIWPTLGYPDQQEVALRAINEALEIMK